MWKPRKIDRILKMMQSKFNLSLKQIVGAFKKKK